MLRAGVVVVAGFAAFSGITTTDACAEDCPQWLKWVCSGSVSPNAVATQGSRQDKQLSKTKPASRAVIAAKTKTPKPQEAARAAQPDAANRDSANEELFQAFLEWDKKRRVNR
jgi:hypothetical protein